MANYKQITQKQAKKMMEEQENIVILDVRTEQEYSLGHIKDAIVIPVETIQEAKKQLLDKEQVILVYCRSGHRSKAAAMALAEMGYLNIYEFGGIMDWQYETVID